MTTKELLKIDFTDKSAKLPDLNQARRILAKTANQRLLKLERTTSKISGKKYTFGAYDVAQDYLQEQGLYGKKRFSEGVLKSMTTEELVQEINVLQQFLESKSSTIRGMREIENARIKTLETNFGLTGEITRNEKFYKFLNSEIYKQLEKAFGSKRVIEAYDEADLVSKKQADINKVLEDFITNENEVGYKDLIEKLKAIPISNSMNL